MRFAKKIVLAMLAGLCVLPAFAQQDRGRRFEIRTMDELKEELEIFTEVSELYYLYFLGGIHREYALTQIDGIPEQAIIQKAIFTEKKIGAVEHYLKKKMPSSANLFRAWKNFHETATALRHANQTILKRIHNGCSKKNCNCTNDRSSGHGSEEARLRHLVTVLNTAYIPLRRNIDYLRKAAGMPPIPDSESPAQSKTFRRKR